MSAQFRRLLKPDSQWCDPASGYPTQPFYQYMVELDRALRAALLKGSPVTVAALPAGEAGDQRFVTDGRKNGEGAGSGTGVLAYFDGSHWIATDTGTTVAA